MEEIVDIMEVSRDFGIDGTSYAYTLDTLGSKIEGEDHSMMKR